MTIPDDEITTAFAGAWIKCMTEHGADLVSGPCTRCAIEAGEQLRLADSKDSRSSAEKLSPGGKGGYEAPPNITEQKLGDTR